MTLARSADMATHLYLSHDTLNGLSPYDRLRKARVHYSVVGENIGFEEGSNRRHMVADIETSMMHSPEHRAKILRSGFTKVGIGIIIAGQRLYVTEDFKG